MCPNLEAEAVAKLASVPMEIRRERPDDAEAVAEVHRGAFGDHAALVALLLVDDLRALLNRGRGLSLVAERRERVVGHVMFSRGLLDAPERLVAVQILSPLAMRRDAQRMVGIASNLTERGLAILSAQRVPAVFVEGDPGLYSRLGFVPAGPIGFRKPSLRIPDAAFQMKTLSADQPWMTGTLVYPEPFWRDDAVGLRGLDADDGDAN